MSDEDYEQEGLLPADLRESYAVIYAPRRQRQRYPENTVQVVDTEQEALARSDATKHLFAARVCGPFRSSEGFRLFYLVRWLGEE
ncbi:hypothetical protein [Sulfurivermis fontis]|jgi:hypothetical protein|uniref:hypothetical protein n=1 Tax=Sulfurivermis fontis TaxID=1972068 RepID=UPI000FD8D69D|nr:hypothetical protein [Sulfurivermis fontis]